MMDLLCARFFPDEKAHYGSGWVLRKPFEG
jgi:hypothetical protein